MATPFSKMLLDLRIAAGFPTAYRFYHSSGGRNILGLSYRAYLLIESGKNLPAPERLKTFMGALRLISKGGEANAFVTAWLQSMMGADNFRELIIPLLANLQQDSALSPMQKAMKKSIIEKTFQITVQQVEVIHASLHNYLCFLAMTHDTGAWKPKELAKCLKMPEAAALTALKALTAAKLMKLATNGSYKSDLTGLFKTYPHQDLMSPELRKKVADHDSALASAGEELYPRNLILRADESELRNFFPMMDVNLDAAGTYAINKKSEKSALFMIQGKVTKIRNF